MDLLRAHPARLWIALLPPLAGCLAVAAASALGALHLPALPFAIAAFFLSFALGVLVSRALPGRRRVETSARQLQAVSTVIGKAGGTLELQQVLDAITLSTVEVTGVRGCSIKLLDPNGRTMSVRSLAGLERTQSELPAETAEDIATRSLMHGQPVLVDGAQRRDFPELDDATESLICVPLRGEGRVIGALCVYGEKGKRLSPDMLSFLSRLGDLAVLSIANASVYQSLKNLDEARSWFLRRAAHELVSPLSVIQSISQNLLQGYLGDMSDRQKEEIERMRARAAGLSEVVGDLLALARSRAQASSSAGESQAGIVDLCAALSETVAFFQAGARERGVPLSIGAPCTPCPVRGSMEGVKSIVSNLVSNAIKYSPPGRSVSILLERTAAGTVLSVVDHGIGIPSDERDRLCSEFFRASNARAFTESGTGLGMAVVASEVKAMGGTLDIRSAEGEGTTVKVLLPAATATERRGRLLPKGARS
jgi:signal transduction histidine kinase